MFPPRFSSKGLGQINSFLTCMHDLILKIILSVCTTKANTSTDKKKPSLISPCLFGSEWILIYPPPEGPPSVVPDCEINRSDVQEGLNRSCLSAPKRARRWIQTRNCISRQNEWGRTKVRPQGWWVWPNSWLSTFTTTGCSSGWRLLSPEIWWMWCTSDFWN